MNSEQNSNSLRTENLSHSVADTPPQQADDTPSQITLSTPAASDAFRTLDVPLGTTSLAETPAGKGQERFGDYELLEPIGKGGMGVVYRARQVGLNRIVALKQIRAGEFADEREIERFYAEARAAGGLNHPGIVPIYDVGQWGGQPFFSMGYVQGESLQERLARGPLVPLEAAQLVKQVAEAVEHAHRQGIVHRDLKPGNILIDAENQPRVTDFGLAKRTDGDTGLTMTGQVLGTPAYMPPEQAQALHEQVGPRSDVYALGAVLYAVLSGRPPFQAASRDAIMRQVIHDEPVALRIVNPSVPQDLETIAFKCLEKEPSRRYSSARELADDFGRFLNHEPVLARPITPISRAIRWCLRKPVAAGLIGVATLLVLVLAIGGPVVAVVFSEQKRQLAVALKTANEQTTKANTATTEAQRQVRVATAERLASDSNATRLQFPDRSTLLALEAIEATRSHGEPAEFAAEQALRAALDSLGGYPLADAAYAAFSNDGRWLATANTDEATKGTAKLWDLAADEPLRSVRVLRGHQHFIFALAFSPDSQWLATGGADGIVQVWNLMTLNDAPVMVLRGHTASIQTLEFAADSRSLATGSLDETARLWDLTAANPSTDAKVFSHRHFVMSLALSPDGQWLITGSGEDGKTAGRIWNLKAADPTSNPHILPHDSYVECLAISPDGRWLATGSAAGIARIWDLSLDKIGTQVHELKGHVPVFLKGNIRSLAFTPDGRCLVTCSQDKTIRVWDLVDKSTPIKVLYGHEAAIDNLVISPDGRWLVTGDRYGVCRLWDLETSEPAASARVLRGGALPHISPDGRWLVVGGASSARIWDITAPESSSHVKVLRGHTDMINSMALSKDGSRLVTGGNDFTARSWDLAAEEPRLKTKVASSDGFIDTISLTSDGQQMAFGTLNNVLAVCDLATFKLKGFNLGSPIYKLALSANDKWLVAACGGRCFVIDLTKPIEKPVRFQADVNGMLFPAVSSDGRWVAAGVSDGTVLLWDLHLLPADQPKVLHGHDVQVPLDTLKGTTTTGNIFSLAISPDDRWLATAGSDEKIRLWDLNAADPTKPAKVLAGPHAKYASPLAFTRDGLRLITCSINVAIWNLGTRSDSQPERILRGHSSNVRDLAVSTDGRWLVTAGQDQIACVWDLQSGGSNPIKVLSGHEAGIECVKLSADGRWLVTAGIDHTARVWDLNLDSIQYLGKIRAGRELSAEEGSQYRITAQPPAKPAASHPPLAPWQRPRVLHHEPVWHLKQAQAAKPGSFAEKFHALWHEKLEMDGVQARGFVP